MYLYNEFTINILNTLSFPSKSNSKLIELKVHTSCYRGHKLTLCYKWYFLSPTIQVARDSNPAISNLLLPNQDFQETWTCKTNLKTKIWYLSFNF